MSVLCYLCENVCEKVSVCVYFVHVRMPSHLRAFGSAMWVHAVPHG